MHRTKISPIYLMRSLKEYTVSLYYCLGLTEDVSEAFHRRKLEKVPAKPPICCPVCETWGLCLKNHYTSFYKEPGYKQPSTR